MEDSPWRPSIQMAVANSEGGSCQRIRFSPGIVIDQTNTSVLIMLCLRPTRPDPTERNADANKHLIQLIYNSQNNAVTRRGAAEDDTNGVGALLAGVSEQYARSGECSLWPAVHTLAHRFMMSPGLNPGSNASQR
ncbi:hypothetical protein AB6A40_003003 [Gnathostoma spinigerum]|uniref:Uncharacterized protein n=1 Tax=Gnathostoma spinigerum TaxID=75299 RepID=A0ABD6EG20_9BILA